MLTYFNRKESRRYLTFKRKRFLTSGGSRVKVLYDRKKKILWVKPIALIGQPITLASIKSLTFQLAEITINDVPCWSAKVIAKVDKGQILIYELFVATSGQQALVREHLEADLKDIIREILTDGSF